MNQIIKRICERFENIEKEMKLIIEDLLEYEKSLDEQETKSKKRKQPMIPKFKVPSISSTMIHPCRYPPRQSKKLKPRFDIEIKGE